MKRLITTLTLAMTTFGLAPNADALSFARHPSLQEIAKEAPLSFRGLVKQIRFVQAETASEVPYTEITFVVQQAYAGTETGAQVTLYQMGGPLADKGFVIIPGLATFDLGQSVVVLSNDSLHPFFATAFGDQGALYVRSLEGRSIITTSDGRTVVEQDGIARYGDDRCASRTAACKLEPIFANRKTRSELSPMTVETFDAWMFQNAAAAARGVPAQTVSASRARFEAALLRLGGAK